MLSIIFVLLSFALFGAIQLDVLLLDKLLQFVDLLAVKVHTHLVSCCNQVRMNLHLQTFFVFIAFLALNLVVVVIIRLVCAMHRAFMVETSFSQLVVLLIVDAALFIAVLF